MLSIDELFVREIFQTELKISAQIPPVPLSNDALIMPNEKGVGPELRAISFLKALANAALSIVLFHTAFPYTLLLVKRTK